MRVGNTRGNVLFASAARALAQDYNSEWQDNPWHRGAYIIVDVTALAATPSVTPKIEIRDPVSESIIALHTATAITNVTGVGEYVYLIHPEAGAAAEGVDEVRNFPLPVEWRLTMTHGDTDSITYSVAVLPVI